MSGVFCQSRDKPHSVYLCQLTKDSQLKIGLTISIQLRLKKLARDNKSVVKLVAYKECKDYWKAQDLETKWHRDLNGGSKGSEYYPFAASIVSEFLSQRGVTICL